MTTTATGPITIRLAMPEDAPILRELTQELAEFDKMPTSPQLSAEQFAIDLRAGLFQAFLAVSSDGEGVVAGMAVFVQAYSTWQGKYLHLEDLYVREQWRGHGLGKRLIAEVAKQAKERGMKRVGWTVFDWNTSARALYEKVGAVNLTGTTGWLIYRLDQQAIEALVNGSE